LPQPAARRPAALQQQRACTAKADAVTSPDGRDATRRQLCTASVHGNFQFQYRVPLPLHLKFEVSTSAVWYVEYKYSYSIDR
jgi:hypothetical protein